MRQRGRSTSGRERGPQRTCFGCRRKAAQRHLLRLVRSPEGEILVDHPHRLGGRGVYVCSRLGCMKRALRSARLSQSIGGTVRPMTPAELAAEARSRIRRRVSGLMAAAGRARAAALGAANTATSLRSGEAKLVIVAGDLSSRVRRDLATAATTEATSLVTYGDREELGKPFARTVLGAMAVEEEGFAEAIRGELFLLDGLVADEEELTKTSRVEDMALERAT